MSKTKGKYVKPKPRNVALLANQKAKINQSAEFDQRAKTGAQKMGASLIPRGASNSGGSSNEDSENYKKMLKDMDDKYQGKFADMSNAYDQSSRYMNDKVNSLGQSLDTMGKSNQDMRKALGSMDERYQNAFKKLAGRSGGGKTNGGGSPGTGGVAANTPNTGGVFSTFYGSEGPDPLEVIDNTAKGGDDVNTEVKTSKLISREKPEDVDAESTETVVEENSSSEIYTTPYEWRPSDDKPFDDENLTIGKYYNVGGFNLRPTNLFGYRSGVNKVAGRKSTELAGGIDYVETNGNAIMIDDGVVVRVHSQGNPYVRHPDKKEKDGEQTKPSGGWIVTVKNKKTGLYSMYMHMDTFSASDVKSLVGKEFKRGEKFWTAKVGSGTQTGPHVKVTQYMNPDNYNEERSIYNPSKFISGGEK